MPVHEVDHMVESADGVRLHVALCSATPLQTLKQGGAPVPRALLVTHPHTLLGGSADMLQPFSHALVASVGGLVVRVSTRGAGASSGWGTIRARSEIKDVIAAVNWLHDEFGTDSIHIVGYSTGSCVGSSAMDRSEYIKGLVALGYPFGGWTGVMALAAKCALGSHFDAVTSTEKPVVFIQGDWDEFTTVSSLEEHFANAKEPKAKHVLPGVGHFSILGRGAVQSILRIIGEHLEQHG